MSDEIEPGRFERVGAERLAGAALAELSQLEHAVADAPVDRPGVRLFGNELLRDLLAPGAVIGGVAAAMLGSGCRPVRAILFEKSAAANWGLDWHQDRTIAVRSRVDVPGFGPWTIKQGLLHVAPPFEVLAAMVTLRIHLDPAGASNAPLLIAPGSHKLGRIAESDLAEVVERCGIATCLADAGDVWVYSTPIVHASAASAEPRRRRVLRVDYAPGPLPGGLEWLGI